MKVPGKFITDILGADNIEHDFEAVYELVKNSIDAEAKNIIVDFSKIEEDIISITDDGSGANKDELLSSWNALKSSKVNLNSLGGKGIGRFTAFKLGDTIRSISKCEDKEYEICFNRRELESVDDIAKFKFDILDSINGISTETGTQIIISDLKITSKSLYDIIEKLQIISHPFKKVDYNLDIKIPEEFKQDYPCDDNKTYGLFSVDYAIKSAPFYFGITLENGLVSEIHDGYYLEKGGEKQNYINEKNEMKFLNSINQSIQKDINELAKRKNVSFDDLSKFGKVTLNLYSFYFHNTSEKQFVSNDEKKQIQAHFLNVYQGINIYRNDMLISGFGKNDWLKLAEDRVARSSDTIDNKLTFGYVELEAHTKKDLLPERTNRYGFSNADNEELLQCILKNAIKVFSKEIRKKQKNELIEFKKKTENQMPLGKKAIPTNEKEIKPKVEKKVNPLEKLSNSFRTYYGDDLDFESKIASEINNFDKKKLNIEYPASLKHSNGVISGRNKVGVYNNICLSYDGHNRNLTMYINAKEETITSQRDTRVSKLDQLIKFYTDNYSEYPKFIDYVNNIKTNVKKEVATAEVCLVIQSFLEMNFKLFLNELNGVEINRVKPQDKSGHKIRFEIKEELAINDYETRVMQLLYDNKHKVDMKNFYISLNAFKHNLSEPMVDHVINKYFDYCHDQIVHLLKTIVSNK